MNLEGYYMTLQKYIFVFIMMNNQKFSCDKGNYKNYLGRDWAGVGAGTRVAGA